MPDNVPPGAIVVVCGHCGAKLFTKPTSIGRMGKCAGCGQMIEMSPAITLPPAPPPRPAGSEPSLPPPASSRALPPELPPNMPVVRISFAQDAKATPPQAAPAQPVAPPAVRPVGAAKAPAAAPPPPPTVTAPKSGTIKSTFKPKSAPAPASARPVFGAKAAPASAKPAPEVKAAPASAKPAPEVKAAPASAKPAPEVKAAPASAKPAKAPSAAPASTTITSRTQVVAPSAATLAMFGKGPAAEAGRSKPSAVESFPTPDGPMRIWGQWRQATPSANGSSAHGNPGKGGLAARLSRPHLIMAGAALAILILGVIGLVALKATPGPSAAGSDADWTAMDYTTFATARGKESGGSMGDTIVRIRVKFDVRFSGLGGLSAEDWEVRDSGQQNRPFYNVSFSVTDKTNRVGLLGFAVSGSWRPADVTFRVKREETWASLADVPCKD